MQSIQNRSNSVISKGINGKMRIEGEGEKGKRKTEQKGFQKRND